jgi:flagellar P-ring protein precursor FlgI
LTFFLTRLFSGVKRPRRKNCKANAPSEWALSARQKVTEVVFLADIGALEVTPDTATRVLINKRTGALIAKANVRISTVAISHGALTISIASNVGVSQPTEGGIDDQTATTESTQTDVKEAKGGFRVMDEFPAIEKVAAALNALGVTARDMMAIFQAKKQAGALQAELVME